jgi:ATP-binding cassette subfamily B protein
MNTEQNFLQEAVAKTKKAFWYVFFFSAAINLMMLGLPIFTLQVLDRVVSSGSIETLVMLTIVTTVIFIAFGAFSMIRQMTLIRIGEWLDRTTSERILSTSLSISSSNKNHNSSQSLRDLATVKGFIAGPALTAYFDLPWAFLFIGVLMAIHPIIGLLAVAGAILLSIAGVVNERAVKKALSQSNELSVKSMNQIETSSRNAEVIEAMGMMDAIVSSWQEKNKHVVESQVLANSRSAVISSVAKSLRMLLQIFAVAIGTALFLSHEVSVGAIIAGSILLGRALAPFEQSIAAWSSFTGARKAYERLNETLDKAPAREQSMDLPEPEGRLSAENVIFALPGTRQPIVKGITFSMPPGASLGIIGPSASGKSTLAKLFMGIYKPNSGNVRLDGADVYTWNRKDFGRHVGYLPQDVELFDGNVRDNIARLQADASDADVITAAKLAGAHDLILRLTHGYNTEIGVGGGNLSAGQRQRIGLARAFFGQPKLVVLDEPNSNLDEAGEAALMAAIKNAKALNITVIIIAHRAAVLSAVDKIMVMKDGAIADYGDAKEILTKYAGGAKPAAPAPQKIQKQTA